MGLQLSARINPYRGVGACCLSLALFIGGLFYGQLSAASTEMSKTDLLSSDLVVSAVKLSGRVGCDALHGYKDRYSVDVDLCYGSKRPGGVSAYNQSIDSEDFLVLKVLKGKVDKFSVLKIPYQDSLGGNSLELGEAYLLFLNKEGGGYSYQPCRSAKYANVVEPIKKGATLEKLVEYIYAENKFECSELSTEWEDGKQGNAQ